MVVTPLAYQDEGQLVEIHVYLSIYVQPGSLA